jgi:hypothetical protein
MQPIQPKRFLHTLISPNSLLIQSQCENCGTLIAAGTFDKYLAIAEFAHRCSHHSLAEAE